MSKNTILCFDTESTSLLKTVNDIDNFYILQLSWMIYNTDQDIVISENDFILKCPILITNSHIHGITDEISAKGYDFSEIIDIFLEDVKNCDKIVAYNLQYDLNALEIELDRFGRHDDIDILFEKPYFDPMRNNIFNTKYLKLTELYHKLFGEEFDGAHNALEDVKATLRVYNAIKNR